ncbi:MAG: hypothetical protein N2260_06900 [Syntrophobacterales bacterium]|nr:hypothetical protein [Syntrophobacterales bacterium]
MYSVKKVSEILAISEKEVFEAIRSGMLPASLENNEWLIPEWGLRVFLRTQKVLERLENRGGGEDSSERDILKAILSRVELILEQSQQEKIILELIRQNEELKGKVFELEERLKSRELEIERLRSEFLGEMVEREEKLKQIFHEERRKLEIQIMDLERKLHLRKSRDEFFEDYAPSNSSSPRTVEDTSFWRRLVKMLTWD